MIPNLPQTKLKDVTNVATSILKKAFKGVNIGIVQDKGFQDTEIETHLNGEGACLIVAPLVTAVLRDQSGPAWILDCEVMVKVQVNPEKNSAMAGANVDIYDVVTSVVKGICSAPRISGGSEFFKASRDCVALSQFAEGMWAYDLLFTKEALL